MLNLFTEFQLEMIEFKLSKKWKKLPTIPEGVLQKVFSKEIPEVLLEGIHKRLPEEFPEARQVRTSGEIPVDVPGGSQKELNFRRKARGEIPEESTSETREATSPGILIGVPKEKTGRSYWVYSERTSCMNPTKNFWINS